jgi:hypothetical protein
VLPAERGSSRLVVGLLERRLDPLVLCGVPFDQGDTQAEVDVGRADVGRATGSRIEDEEARNETSDEDCVFPGESQVSQEVGRLAENHL